MFYCLMMAILKNVKKLNHKILKFKNQIRVNFVVNAMFVLFN
jgi:hypothetical protein